MEKYLDDKEYIKEKKTVSLVKANLFSLALLPLFGLLYYVPFFIMWDFEGVAFGNLDMFCFILIFIGGIVVHELIHGITWALFAKNGFRSIKFGVLWKMLTPYCHCKEPLRLRHYILGGLSPLIFVGVIPALVGIIIGNFYLMNFGFLFSAAAAGDIMIVLALWNEDKDTFVQDHPSEAGCYVYRKRK
ncbi:MAG: DUF3267 domain-containing protein [Bacteroides sp.]|nr:DUF3267 domain-containing protein [Bacteroides sp.]